MSKKRFDNSTSSRNSGRPAPASKTYRFRGGRVKVGGVLLNDRTLDADRQAFQELKCDSKEKENGRINTENDGLPMQLSNFNQPKPTHLAGLPISALTAKTVTSTITMKGKNIDKENNVGAVTDWS